MNVGTNRTLAHSWLLLIHQLPAKPAYLRVKIWRRLQDLGAIAVKNAVHALPMNEETQEDFEWGHATMENRHGLAVAGMVTLATGTAERRASETMLKAKVKKLGRRITVGE